MAKKSEQFVRSHLQAKILLEKSPAEAKVDIGHARLQSFSADHDYGTTPVHGVGDYEAAEHVHLKFAGSIQLEAFMIRKADLVAQGLAALGAKILETGVMSIELYDPDTQKTVRQYEGVVISRYTETVREGQICGENATAFFRTVTHDEDLYGDDNKAPDPSGTVSQPTTTPAGATTAAPGDNTAGAPAGGQV